MGRYLLGAFTIVGGLILTGYWSVTGLNSPPRLPTEQAVFSVEPGDSLSRVAARLEAQNVIRSARFMRVAGRLLGTDGDVKVGHYAIPKGATTLEVHNLLVEGHQEQIKVTIPEGWTINKISTHLEALGVTGAADFQDIARSRDLLDEYLIEGDSVEGYLFPDTYFMLRSYPAEAVARTMMDNFFRRVEAVVPGFGEMDPGERHRTLILASIVEREYQRPEEAPLIASVFYNRLQYNIGLESCATIAYILTEIQGESHPEIITHRDLGIDSLFNTYKWHGLPPGPISNPGLVALEATFAPADTDYWYFVLKNPSTGEHYFSRDLDEHNEAKFYYLKGPASS